MLYFFSSLSSPIGSPHRTSAHAKCVNVYVNRVHGRERTVQCRTLMGMCNMRVVVGNPRCIRRLHQTLHKI
jgi:hypothetical protein